MQRIGKYVAVLSLVAVTLTGCSKSDEYYEMLGEEGRVATLLSELESDNAKVRANALTGLGIAATYADPAHASKQHRDPVDPSKLVPAVEPVIKALRDEDGFVRYCARYALRYLAEYAEGAETLTRITDALIEHKPPVQNGDDYSHYVEGLTAIAARAEEAPELAATAQAALDAEREPAAGLEAEREK